MFRTETELAPVAVRFDRQLFGAIAAIVQRVDFDVARGNAGERNRRRNALAKNRRATGRAAEMSGGRHVIVVDFDHFRVRVVHESGRREQVGALRQFARFLRAFNGVFGFHERNGRPAELRFANIERHAVKLLRRADKTAEDFRIRRVDGKEALVFFLIVPLDLAEVVDDLFLFRRSESLGQVAPRVDFFRVFERVRFRKIQVGQFDPGENGKRQRRIDSQATNERTVIVAEQSAHDFLFFLLGHRRRVVEFARPRLNVAANEHPVARGQVRDLDRLRAFVKERAARVAVEFVPVRPRELERRRPVLERGDGGEHDVPLGAILVRIRMVVLGAGERSTDHANRRQIRERSCIGRIRQTRVFHEPVVAVPLTARKVRMVPVRVNVAVVEPRLIVPEPVLELRPGNERFDAERLDVLVHFLPIRIFQIVQEIGEVGESFFAEQRRLALFLRDGNRSVFDRLIFGEAQIAPFAERDVGDFKDVAGVESAERNSRHVVVFRRDERRLDRRPFVGRFWTHAESESMPGIVRLRMPDVRRFPGFYAQLEFQKIRRSFLDFQPGEVELRMPRHVPDLFDAELKRGRADSRLGRGHDFIAVFRIGVRLESPAGVKLEVFTDRGDFVLAKRNRLAVPRLAQVGGRPVFFQQPLVPQRAEFVAIRLRQVVQLSPRPARDDRVFVIDFDDRDAGVVRIRLARVRVDVREQVFGVFLLILDHFPIEIVDAFVLRRELSGVGEPVDFFERAGNVEVDIDIDPFLLETIDHVVKSIELIGVDFGRAFVKILAPNVARIHVMKAHDPDSEPRERIGDALGFFFGCKTRAKTEIRAE